MIHFFVNQKGTVYSVQIEKDLSTEDIAKLNWLFGNSSKIEQTTLEDFYVGPRAAMITPWSTNAVEITQNMGIQGITRIEQFELSRDEEPKFDKMLQDFVWNFRLASTRL